MSREVDEIKSKIDIVDLVGEYVKLTPAGANHRGLCPFHNEKTPSFMVNGSRQIWRCFGCGEGGDIFSFFMKAEGIEFGEAIKLLAQRAGVVLPQYHPTDVKKDSQTDRLYKILDLSARYFHKVFLDSGSAQIARDYLAQRKISKESIDDFQIGYSVDSWDNLILFLKKKGFSDREIFAAGLSVQKSNGGFYDRFRDRIMFPISDVHGRTVGFGGRALKKEEQAKYINSPQGEAYNKSAVLYGLNQAKNHIKKSDLCVLVEGYMDVIPSHQTGVKNVVSISGTALTQEQIVFIKRFTSNLALALDMDLAGQNAAERSADLALQNEMNVNVIMLPHGKDPGECATNNPDDWKKAIADAIPVMQYFLDRATQGLDLSKSESKKLAAKAFLQKIMRLPNKIDSEFWLKKLADKISVSEKILWELMPSEKSRPMPGVRNKVNESLIISKENDKKDKNYLILQRIISLLCIYPKFTQKIIDELPQDIFAGALDSLYKKLIMYYTKNIDLFNGASGEGANFDLFDSFRKWIDENSPERESQILLEESFLMSQNDVNSADEKECHEELANLLKTLKVDYINSKITALKARLEEAEKKSDRQTTENVYSQLSELIQRKALLE